MPRRTGCPGFTLMELLVVLVLISVVAAVVGVRAGGGLSGAALRDAAKKTAATLRYARSQASWEGVPYVVLFSFEDNALALLAARPETGDREEPEADRREVRRDELGRVILKTYTLPEGVRLEKAVWDEDERASGLFEIVFSPSGGCTGGELVFINEREARYRVAVDFITGGVQLTQVVD
ncbi:GspH/FimT family pseudopilin [Desulfatiglans anilini]|uniref:GspH/FimT family pseudopilin n=1 Tax=Desulfatiglans anilini TaxID=90728 RepID=UPI000409211C|nr:GspH/FimT family pseudopilin [Desulfatiglans anilini]